MGLESQEICRSTCRLKLGFGHAKLLKNGGRVRNVKCATLSEKTRTNLTGTLVAKESKVRSLPSCLAMFHIV